MNHSKLHALLAENHQEYLNAPITVINFVTKLDI